MNKKRVAILVGVVITVGFVGTTGIVGQFLNNGPTAQVSSTSPSYEQGPDRVEITARSSTDPDGDELRYSYDTDNDGVYEVQYMQSPVITRNFSSTGTYRVNTKVFDSYNETDTDTTVVKLNEPPTLSSLTVSEASEDQSATGDGINTFRAEINSSESLETIQLGVTKGSIKVEFTEQDFVKASNENSYVTRFDVAAEQVPELTVTVEKAVDKRGTSASNVGLSRTVSSDSDAPRVLSLNTTQNSNAVSITIEDTGSGVNEDTIGSGDFRLFAGTSDDRVEKTVTSTTVSTTSTETTVGLTTDTTISRNNISVELDETAQISDFAGNQLSNPDTGALAQASGVDAVPPSLRDVRSISATRLLINVTDSGSGVDTTSVSADTVSVGTTDVQSVSQVENPQSQTVQFDITLQSAVSQSQTTLTLTDLSDKTGNSHQVDQSVEIEDNASPVIESVDVVNGKTVELTIVDESSAVQSNALSASDFQVDDADVAFVTTEQTGDGIRADIELNEIQQESTQLSVVGSIPDTAGNSLESYQTNVDTLEPSTNGGGGGGGGDDDDSYDSGGYYG